MATPNDSSPIVVDSQKEKVLNCSIVLTVFGAVFVLARLYARFVRSKSHGWDDYFICFALVRTYP